MVENYCKDENTIMLCVSNALVDLENCKGLNVCRKIDFEGKRTIGVLTKCDRLDIGQESKVLKKALVDSKFLKYGYRAIINATPQ